MNLKPVAPCHEVNDRDDPLNLGAGVELFLQAPGDDPRYFELSSKAQ